MRIHCSFWKEKSCDLIHILKIQKCHSKKWRKNSGGKKVAYRHITLVGLCRFHRPKFFKDAL